mmetsp:Transcript_28840/g.96735  ORF Transcript_28840/g.96735 Transcript_28840/m.96735 type:complete len:253 (-) Transcript_28840:262-1020(-)
MKRMLPSIRFFARMRISSFSSLGVSSPSASSWVLTTFSFSNSSWHLLSSSRLKVTGLLPGLSASWNSGKDSEQRAQSVEYIVPNTGSASALSKTWSMMPTMSARDSTGSSRNWPASLSNFSGASLLRMDLQSRSSFSPASTSFFAIVAATYAFSVFSSGLTSDIGMKRCPPLPPPLSRPPLPPPFWNWLLRGSRGSLKPPPPLGPGGPPLPPRPPLPPTRSHSAPPPRPFAGAAAPSTTTSNSIVSVAGRSV